MDGRGVFACRPLTFSFGTKDGHCVARLGDSVACACVSVSLEQPYKGRPSEGVVSCHVKDIKARGSKGQRAGWVDHHTRMVELGRFLERSFKESKAIDLESLCVQSGRRVWHVQVDVTLLNDDGNALDVLGYAMLGALRVYKRPEVTLDPLMIHSLEDREGVPFTLHHFPVALTFASVGDGGVTVLDPNALEEAVADGFFTVSITPQGDVCAVQKTHGDGVEIEEVMRCMRVGMEVARKACGILDEALKAHDVARVAARVRRTRIDGDVVVAVGSSGGDHHVNDDERVRMALDAAVAPIEDDDDDDDMHDDEGAVMVREDGDRMDDIEETTTRRDSSDGATQQRGRKYVENKSKKDFSIRKGKNQTYKTASDLIAAQGDDADTLADALN